MTNAHTRSVSYHGVVRRMAHEIGWTEESEQHIARHGVGRPRSKVAYAGPRLTARGREDTQLVFGTTEAGRHCSSYWPRRSTARRVPERTTLVGVVVVVTKLRHAGRGLPPGSSSAGRSGVPCRSCRGLSRRSRPSRQNRPEDLLVSTSLRLSKRTLDEVRSLAKAAGVPGDHTQAPVDRGPSHRRRGRARRVRRRLENFISTSAHRA